MSLEITEELIARQPPEAQAIIRVLLAQVEELQRQVRELQSRLDQTPRNSSRPPSSEHPHAKPKRKAKPKGKRQRGGQKGHKKHQRRLIPAEQCDQTQALKPKACRRCGERLSGSDKRPLRHQVWELPEIRLLVTEYQQHRLTCACCGETTCAPLPPGVPQSTSGPRLVAFTALLMGHFRQSKRRAAYFLQDLLKMPCCGALTVKMQNQASAALERPYDELKQSLTEEPRVFMDESPTKQANRKAWLWTAVAPLRAVFAIFDSRKGEAVPKLLGERYGGVIHCDRAKMYWQAERLQWCWAHLKRDIQALIDHPDNQVKRLGHDLMRQVKLMFDYWSRYKAGKIQRPTFRKYMRPVREEVYHLLLRGRFSGNRRLVGMCKELYAHEDWLWTFVDVEGVEPTNNTAERALRPAVIHRKLSFGTQSAQGSRFIERMLTMSETCRLQDRSIFDYLTAAVEAHFSQQAPPSLLPEA